MSWTCDRSTGVLPDDDSSQPHQANHGRYYSCGWPDGPARRGRVSLVPLLKSRPFAEDRTLYWHYPHYHGSTWTPGASIRDGDWKLIEFYHWDKVELYNLKSDPGERKDLYEKNPDKARQLLGKLHKWQQQMAAKMPQPISQAD
ncbi:MAG: DUF4976 domain-containing protein [Planctomycetes bacterium]|nr:DUF4976 domain-containing protein [Planctomycetota bacterium]